MISNTSSSISVVPSSQSAHNLISPMNVSNNNQNNATSGPLINNVNGSLIVSHSQSAHQIGHAILQQQQQQQQQQTPHTPLAAHHQALQQQLQKHFANNNMGEWKILIHKYLLFISLFMGMKYAHVKFYTRFDMKIYMTFFHPPTTISYSHIF